MNIVEHKSLPICTDRLVSASSTAKPVQLRSKRMRRLWHIARVGMQRVNTEFGKLNYCHEIWYLIGE